MDASVPIEENISVSVRVRPLNEREVKKSDSSVWSLHSDTTLQSESSIHTFGRLTRICRAPHSPLEYSRLPGALDHVFGPDHSTRDVYDKVGKGVVSSVIEGMNGKQAISSTEKYKRCSMLL